jgi:hypothetical protein
MAAQRGEDGDGWDERDKACESGTPVADIFRQVQSSGIRFRLFTGSGEQSEPDTRGLNFPDYTNNWRATFTRFLPFVPTTTISCWPSADLVVLVLCKSLLFCR